MDSNYEAELYERNRLNSIFNFTIISTSYHMIGQWTVVSEVGCNIIEADIWIVKYWKHNIAVCGECVLWGKSQYAHWLYHI